MKEWSALSAWDGEGVPFSTISLRGFPRFGRIPFSKETKKPFDEGNHPGTAVFVGNGRSSVVCGIVFEVVEVTVKIEKHERLKHDV